MIRLLRRFFGLDVPALYISLQRANDEDRKVLRDATYGDVEYRAKIKRRMVEGAACTLQPLYDRPKLLRRRRKTHVVAFKRTA